MQALPFPLGLTLQDGGANVAVVSRHAERIYVCIFDGDTEVARVPLTERLGDVHYGFVPGVTEGTHYGLRAEGPVDGNRFDHSKLLLDPYATRITKPFRHDPELMKRGAESAHLVPKAIAGQLPETAAPLAPHRPHFIYEVSVRAFTKLHPDVPPQKRGTVAALAEPVILDHLKRLGVDTLELMPLCAWIDERHLPALGLANAWGYNPVSFMAPDPRLAPGGLEEIRATVSALHEAGIRVVLDMVFNHTGESDLHGTTLSLRGLDEALYFRRAGSELINDTGCGNTLALDQPHVMQLAMDAMRSWVRRTGIDGFRFDLATVMGRTASGFSADAPLLSAIEQDPLLSRLIMIAEPWDIGPGGYQLGNFPPRWQEWNDRYRDDVRRFWRGDAHMAGAFATRIAGSSDIFNRNHRKPSASINFVAAHDGFSLRDAMTYAAKNNFANGEDNRDGHAHEPTWPGGDARALLATLFLSRGTPMLTAGDEFGRSQNGNNNAYAQDNETTWLDWQNADRALMAFTASVVEVRQTLAPFLADRFLTGQRAAGQPFTDAEWIGADGGPVNWEDNSLVLGLVLSNGTKRAAIIFNRGGAAPLALPRREGYRWTRLFCSADGDGLPRASVSVLTEERLSAHGISDSELTDLASAAGIEGEWWEVDGTHHRVGADTQRSLLSAMGLRHDNDDDLRQSWQVVSSPTPVVMAAGAPVMVWPAGERRRRILIESEHGMGEHDLAPGQALSLSLPPGRYSIRAEDDEAPARWMIVGPGRCFVPEDIDQGTRVFGLASHLYSLRHEASEGIGDFETLRRFAKLTEDAGGRYAGLNPLHHMFPSDRSRASPYQPSDRHYIDPIYISVAQLLARFHLPGAARLADDTKAAFADLEQLKLVDYEKVWAAKSLILEAAFREFTPTADFELFRRDGAAHLNLHGRFEAERMGEVPTEDRVTYRAFLQWIADLQLAEAGAHRNLYRDLALGCAFDGGEIAGSPSAFASGVSIGAPPDPFSSAGQVWNLPPFSPLALGEHGMEPMRRVISANMRHAVALRIDHVLGFARQFWVPRGAEGRFGAYVRFPLDALIAITALESQRHSCLVVGEDLGTVPDGLRDKLADAAIYSYRVLWFEREGIGFKPPAAYPAQALACLASHDLPTFSGWRQGRDIEIAQLIGQLDAKQVDARKTERAEEVRALDALAGSDSSAAVHGLVASTPSRIMLIQADDLAGEIDPLNVPGTDKEWPNWRRRIDIPVEQLVETPLAESIVSRVKQERPE